MAAIRPAAVARARQVKIGPKIFTPRQLSLDMGLTVAISTQLWYHTFCGQALADLPQWTAPRVSLPHEHASRPLIAAAS